MNYFVKILKIAIKVWVIGLWLFLLPFSFLQIEVAIKRQFSNSSEYNVAVVFGAGIMLNREPGKVLRLRLEKAKEMYVMGEVKKIVVTGDNSAFDYNEPQVMKNYLIQNGVNIQDIVVDFGGRRTIDSCYRLANYFNLKKAYLITQSFHVARANFLCQKFGIETVVIEAPKSSQESSLYGIFREIPASFLSIYESYNFKPQILSNNSEEDLSLY